MLARTQTYLRAHTHAQALTCTHGALSTSLEPAAKPDEMARSCVCLTELQEHRSGKRHAPGARAAHAFRAPPFSPLRLARSHSLSAPPAFHLRCRPPTSAEADSLPQSSTFSPLAFISSLELEPPTRSFVDSLRSRVRGRPWKEARARLAVDRRACREEDAGELAYLVDIPTSQRRLVSNSMPRMLIVRIVEIVSLCARLISISAILLPYLCMFLLLISHSRPFSSRKDSSIILRSLLELNAHSFFGLFSSLLSHQFSYQ
eukprot:6197617-Pleurochrysis_carterae.AAC.1